LLVNPEAYKVDDISQGYKKMLKHYDEETSKLKPEEREADPRYTKYVKPFTEYKTAEAEVMNEVRQRMAKGQKKDEILVGPRPMDH